MSARDEGMAALRAGDVPTATQHFQTAVQQTPEDGQAWGGLGLSLCRAGRFAEGVRALEEATRLLPNIASLHYNLALGLEQLGQHERAGQSLNRVLALEPGHQQAPQVLRRLGAAAAAPSAAPGLGIGGPAGAPPPLSSWTPTPIHAEGQGNFSHGGAMPSATASSVPGPGYGPGASAAARREMASSQGGGGGVVKAILGILVGLIVVVGGLLVVGRLGFLGASLAKMGGFGQPLQTIAPGPRIQGDGLGVTAAVPVGFPEPTNAASRMGGGMPGMMMPQMAAYESKTDHGQCALMSINLPPQVFTQLTLDKLKNSPNLTGRMTAQGRVIDSKSIKHDGQDGLEMSIEAMKGGQTEYGRVRIFLVNPRMIMATMAVKKKEHLNAPAVNAFFDSVKFEKQ